MAFIAWLYSLAWLGPSIQCVCHTAPMLCTLRQLFIHGYSRCSSQWKTEGAAISNLLCYRNNCLQYIKAKLQRMQFMHRATFWPICLGLEMVSEVSKVGQRCSNFWSFTNKNNGFHLRTFIKSPNPTVWHGIYNLLFAMYIIIIGRMKVVETIVIVV